MSWGPLRTHDGYGSNRETTYVSSEIAESVALAGDSYITNQTFEGLGVSPGLVAVCERSRHHDGLSYPSHDDPPMPSRAATCVADRQDRVGQDPGLRSADAPTHRVGRALRGPRRRLAPLALADWSCCPPVSWRVQVYEVLKPLGEALGLRVTAVYGGADIERQIKSLR